MDGKVKDHMKKHRATILVDMDEVLANMIPMWLYEYNMSYDDNLNLDMVTDWDTSKLVKPECGKKVYELLKTPGLFRYLEVLPHAQEVIQRLLDADFEVVIVSDSPKGHAYCQRHDDPMNFGNPTDDKREWLLDNFPMIPSSNVVFTSQKWRVMGDLLIDDKPETFEIFQELGRDVLLVDMPYNQHIQTPARIRTLLDAEKYIYDKFPAIHAHS